MEKYDSGNKAIILTGLSTGQMVDQLKIGDEAECRYTDETTEEHLIVHRLRSGAIVLVKNGEHGKYVGQEMVLNANVMKYTWTIYRPIVSFYEAMKAHHKQKKTITYHHDEELTYTFKHELETGQFEGLSNDSLCLHELIQGSWTIDN